jgi:hypothetical protein
VILLPHAQHEFPYDLLRVLTFSCVGPGGSTMIANNTYKSVRLLGEGYNLYYSVWCNNDHELYDLSVSHHMEDIYVFICPANKLLDGSLSIAQPVSPQHPGRWTPSTWSQLNADY